MRVSIIFFIMKNHQRRMGAFKKQCPCRID